MGQSKPITITDDGYGDRLNPLHTLTDPQLALAKKLEDAAEKRKREILERMGVTIERGDKWDLIARRARKRGIIVYHHFIEDHPEGGGWHFTRDGKLEVLLGHPFIEDGRMKFRERVYT